MSTIPLQGPASPALSLPASRRGVRIRFGRIVVGLVVLTAVAGGIFYALRGSGAESSPFIGDVQTFEVRNGLLRITVNDDGNVESSNNLDVKCEVEGGSQILWIVPEGSEVKAGDKLVQLDSSAIEVEIRQQQILVGRAAADLVKGKEDYEVAKIAVTEYLDGTYVKELQTADANIVIARENLNSSKNLLEHNRRMHQKGYINRLQLEASEFAVERSELELQAMETARKVLVEKTEEKTRRQLEATRDAADANVTALDAAWRLEEDKLARLRTQLEKCIIKAPQAGMVIYANERDSRGRSDGPIIEEGSLVRQYQSLIWLPNLEDMQVKTLVHETKIDKVRIGQPAVIRLRGKELAGRVTAVKTQPEPSSWFSMDVKEYAATVSIEKAMSSVFLKPGMTAEVEIVVGEISDALQIPLLGLVQEGSKFFAYVLEANGLPMRKEIKTGESNASFIRVVEGLHKGENIILNPRQCVAEAAQRASQLEKQLQKEKREKVRESQSEGSDSNNPPARNMTGRKTESENSQKPQDKQAVGGGGDGPAVDTSDVKPATDASKTNS